MFSVANILSAGRTMIPEIIIALLLILMITHGCCVRRILLGQLCSMCTNCQCSKCPLCGLKKTGINCKVTNPAAECKCPGCKQYACQIYQPEPLVRY